MPTLQEPEELFTDTDESVNAEDAGDDDYRDDDDQDDAAPVQQRPRRRVHEPDEEKEVEETEHVPDRPGHLEARPHESSSLTRTRTCVNSNSSNPYAFGGHEFSECEFAKVRV